MRTDRKLLDEDGGTRNGEEEAKTGCLLGLTPLHIRCGHQGRENTEVPEPR